MRVDSITSASKMTLRKIQESFINHIRDPDNYPPVVGVDERRMVVYRELMFNNMVSFVTNSFPVLHSLYQGSAWQSLIRKFFIEHDCQSPYFVNIGGEFVDYLANSYQACQDDPVFLVELAHYEWVELEVSIRKGRDEQQPMLPHLLGKTQIVVSYVAWPLTYRFAVHQISTEHIPDQPVEGGVHLIVYRDSADTVQFMEINNMTAILIQQIVDQPGISINQIHADLANTYPQFNQQVLASGIDQMLNKLAIRGIIRHYIED